MKKKYLLRSKWAVTSAIIALALTACGGGNTDTPAGSKVSTQIISFGDSLSDVGTYKVGTQQLPGPATMGGGRFTTNPGAIWVERVATAYHAANITPNVQGGMGFSPSTVGGLGYAQGGARVKARHGIGCTPDAQLGCAYSAGLTYPVSMQVDNYLAGHTDKFAATDLVLVLAGANDIFAQAGSVGAGAIEPSVATANIQTAATDLANIVKNQIVAKGASHVVVLKLPDIGATPFGASQSPAGQALLTALTDAFNAQLTTDLADNASVLLVDLNARFKDILSHLQTYGVSNITTPACDATKIATITSNTVTDGNSLFCSANTLSAVNADTTYLFADGVHPSTLGHQLISDYVLTSLQSKGW